MEHPNLQGLRRWILLTDTAEWLYKKFGFTEVPNPEFYMEKHNPNVYNRSDRTNANTSNVAQVPRPLKRNCK
jgi:N-acetylglutamate synthase-like GNAT family acetyltransferase